MNLSWYQYQWNFEYLTYEDKLYTTCTQRIKVFRYTPEDTVKPSKAVPVDFEGVISLAKKHENTQKGLISWPYRDQFRDQIENLSKNKSTIYVNTPVQRHWYIFNAITPFRRELWPVLINPQSIPYLFPLTKLVKYMKSEGILYAEELKIIKEKI